MDIRRLTLPALALLTLGCAQGAMVEPHTPARGPSLGHLPPDLDLEWPEPPRVDTEVVLDPDEPLNQPLALTRTRVVLTHSLDRLDVDSSDLDIVATPAIRIRRVVIRRGVSRVRFLSGHIGEVRVEAPFAPRDIVQDILFERVRIDGGNPALSVGAARRLAVYQSHVRSRAGAALRLGGDGVASEHVALVDSVFASDRSPAVQLFDVRRAAVVDDWIGTQGLFGLIVGGDSDRVLVTRNTFEGGGLQLGGPYADVGTAWVWMNTLYATGPVTSLEPSGIARLTLAHNTVFTDNTVCMWCGETPDPWTVEANRVSGYRMPPTRPLRP